MPIDADRLIQIAAELKNVEQHRERLLGELKQIAQEVGGIVASVAPRRGRPPGSRNRPKATALAAPARPAIGAKPAARGRGRKRRRGLTTDIVEFLRSGGGAYTAGEIVAALGLPKTKSGVSTVSTTLVRLAKEGRAKKDKQRGYRAA